MSANATSIVQRLPHALNLPAVLTVAVASSLIVLSPGIREAVGEVVWIVSLAVFFFAIVWLMGKFVRWAFSLGAGQRKLSGNERTRLYFTIHSLLGSLSGVTGSLFLSEGAPIISERIAEIYAQLRQFGVSTPRLDPSDPTTDLDDHIAFLRSLQPFIAGAPLQAVRGHAQRSMQNAR